MHVTPHLPDQKGRQAGMYHSVDEDCQGTPPLLYKFGRHLILLHHILFWQRGNDDACETSWSTVTFYIDTVLSTRACRSCITAEPDLHQMHSWATAGRTSILLC